MERESQTKEERRAFWDNRNVGGLWKNMKGGDPNKTYLSGKIRLIADSGEPVEKSILIYPNRNKTASKANFPDFTIFLSHKEEVVAERGEKDKEEVEI